MPQPIEDIDAVTDECLEAVARIISSHIDAGSERDAIMESESLRNAIRTEVTEWSTPY